MPGKNLPRVLSISAAILFASVVASQDRTALFSSLDAASLVGKPVTNAKWEQVARLDSVLFDPATGRVTFYILSFVDGNERVALPWDALSIDERGRVRLVSKKGLPQGALPLGRLPSAYSLSSAVEPRTLEDEPAPALSFIAEGQGPDDATLQGQVTGKLVLPDEAGRRHVQLLMSAGGESVRVDLGGEDALQEIGLELRPGFDVQIQARKTGPREFVATVVRFGGATVRLRER